MFLVANRDDVAVSVNVTPVEGGREAFRLMGNDKMQEATSAKLSISIITSLSTYDN